MKRPLLDYLFCGHVMHPRSPFSASAMHAAQKPTRTPVWSACTSCSDPTLGWALRRIARRKP